MKTENIVRKLDKAVNLITGRIDGNTADERQLAKANELLCAILEALKSNKPKPKP